MASFSYGKPKKVKAVSEKALAAEAKKKKADKLASDKAKMQAASQRSMAGEGAATKGGFKRGSREYNKQLADEARAAGKARAEVDKKNYERNQAASNNKAAYYTANPELKAQKDAAQAAYQAQAKAEAAARRDTPSSRKAAAAQKMQKRKRNPYRQPTDTGVSRWGMGKRLPAKARQAASAQQLPSMQTTPTTGAATSSVTGKAGKAKNLGFGNGLNGLFGSRR